MMSEQLLVTIVTPSYNQARFLEATLRSVLDQDYPNLEYLVVDGASNDGSVDIIRRYADRLAWWVSEKDSGQSEAINKGLKRARGEFIGWLNSDDVYLPGAVTAAVAAFRSHPQAGLVYGDALAIDADGRTFNVMRARPYTLADLMAFNIICQPAAFMRRSVLEQVNYLDPAYHLLMDNLLWMCMAQKAPIVYVPQTWAAARYHDQAKNRTRGAAYGREARVLIDDLKARPDFTGIVVQNEKTILSGVERFDAFYLTDAGQPGAALRAYGRSFRLHPPTALRDWKHILLAFFSLLGLQKIRGWYDRLRTKRLKLDR
ncbi:MAG TPA: glycosyltransferase family 2 protein [Anaerolineales bacterium]|nr:glycosyltransferase family 2 protein [Anaerolineales bacterium]